MKESKTTTKLRIPYQSDREMIITALANSGYKVWVEEVKSYCKTEYLVCYDSSSLSKSSNL